MEEYVYYGELYNIYKELLNKNNWKYYEYYYEENLSLQEIADVCSVSKSYVGSVIKKTSKRLEEYESILHIYENKEKLYKLLEENDVKKIHEVIKNIVK